MSRYANRFFSRHRRLTLAVALTAVGLGALFSKPLAWARPADPSNTDKRIALLVSALMGVERIRRIYAHAIAGRYRFFSYGDASLLLPRG